MKEKSDPRAVIWVGFVIAFVPALFAVGWLAAMSEWKSLSYELGELVIFIVVFRAFVKWRSAVKSRPVDDSVRTAVMRLSGMAANGIGMSSFAASSIILSLLLQRPHTPLFRLLTAKVF